MRMEEDKHRSLTCCLEVFVTGGTSEPGELVLLGAVWGSCLAVPPALWWDDVEPFVHSFILRGEQPGGAAAPPFVFVNKGIPGVAGCHKQLGAWNRPMGSFIVVLYPI